MESLASAGLMEPQVELEVAVVRAEVVANSSHELNTNPHPVFLSEVRSHVSSRTAWL